MIRKITVYFGAAALLMLFFGAAAEAPAQTRQRFVLKNGRGEAGRAVAGRVRGAVTGDKYRDYYFSIPVRRSADISISTDAGEKVVFDLIAPSGKKLFENTEDLLDELPAKGVYTIRVYRGKDKAGAAGRSEFQLGIFMYL